MFGYRRDERTDRESYLEDEVERYREAEEHQREEREGERERKRKEFRKRMREAERTADNWPDALQKQIHLCRKEISGIPDEADLDEFFENEARACERALVIWQEVESVKTLEADKLRERLVEIDGEIVEEVAGRLEKENFSWRHVAAGIRDGEPSEFLNW